MTTNLNFVVVIVRLRHLGHQRMQQCARARCSLPCLVAVRLPRPTGVLGALLTVYPFRRLYVTFRTVHGFCGAKASPYCLDGCQQRIVSFPFPSFTIITITTIPVTTVTTNTITATSIITTVPIASTTFIAATVAPLVPSPPPPPLHRCNAVGGGTSVTSIAKEAVCGGTGEWCNQRPVREGRAPPQQRIHIGGACRHSGVELSARGDEQFQCGLVVGTVGGGGKDFAVFRNVESHTILGFSHLRRRLPYTDKLSTIQVKMGRYIQVNGQMH
jgi:hypothetical protein